MRNYHATVSALSVPIIFALCAATDNRLVTESPTNKSEFITNFPYVVSLKYELKEETFREFFGRLALSEMGCPLKVCNITINDIVDAIQLSKFGSDILADAVGKLNITRHDVYKTRKLYNITVNSTEYLLQKLDLTVTEIYNNLVAILPDPGKTIPQMLRQFNVSVTDLMATYVYGNDTSRLQILSTGNYTEDNINKVLNITNKTGIEILKILPLNKIFLKLRNINSTEVAKFIKSLGITGHKLNSFYDYLNVTAFNFISNPHFIKFVTNIYTFLNEEELIGTFISDNHVVTSNKAKAIASYRYPQDEFIKRYTNFYVEFIEDLDIQNLVKNVFFETENYSKDLVVIETTTKFSGKLPNVTNNFTASALHNCTYVSRLYYGGIYFEHITKLQINNSKIIMPKSNYTVYNLGSPLLCENKLQGIAIEDGINNITFSPVLRQLDATTTIKPPVELPKNVTTRPVGVRNPNSTTKLYSSIFVIFMSFIIYYL